MINYEQLIAGVLVAVLSAVLTVIGYFLKRLIEDVSKIKTDVAVMKVKLVEALNIKEIVRSTYEKVVRLDERQDRMRKDINAMHDARRDLEKRIGGISNG